MRTKPGYISPAGLARCPGPAWWRGGSPGGNTRTDRGCREPPPGTALLSPRQDTYRGERDKVGLRRLQKRRSQSSRSPFIPPPSSHIPSFL